MECPTAELADDEVTQETFVIYERVRTSTDNTSAIHGQIDAKNNRWENNLPLVECGQTLSPGLTSDASDVTEINENIKNSILEDTKELESYEAEEQNKNKVLREPVWAVDIYHDGNDLVILDSSVLDECYKNLGRQENSEISNGNSEDRYKYESEIVNDLKLDSLMRSDSINDNIVDIFHDGEKVVIVDSSADEMCIETIFSKMQTTDSGCDEPTNHIKEDNPSEAQNTIAEGNNYGNNEDTYSYTPEFGLESEDKKQKWIEPEEDIVEEEKNCKITYCLRDLLKYRVKFCYDLIETMDIINSVQSLVELIITKVTSKVDWLPVSRLVRVGSIEEETSILEPNEFDYLVVIDHKGVLVERICQNRKGYAHVKVTDPKLTTLWRKWFHSGFLKGAFTRGIFDNIRHLVTLIKEGRIKKAVDKVVSQLVDGYFKTLGDAFMFEVDSAIRETASELTVERDSGKLYAIKGLRKHGPGFMPTFVWESKKRDEKLEIKVDITPAIELDIPEGFIAEDEVFHKSFWDKLQQHGKLMLIPDHESNACSLGLCFRITFTETELSLMKDLTHHHKEVYKLLKYVFNGGEGYEYLPSYVLKTLVLKHNCYCLETENLTFCFKQIVAACLHYLLNRKTGEKMEWSRLVRLVMRGEKFKLYVPSIFIKDHNILSSKDYPFTCEVFLAEIDSMLESLDEVANSKEPSFKDIKIVNSHKTGAEGYLKALVNKHLELKYCAKCLGRYSDDRIL